MSAPLPAPELTMCVEAPIDPSVAVDVSVLPAKPGVFLFEDADGRTLALASTSNLRRMITAKLAPPATDAGPTRRVNHRPLTRFIRAVRVDSAFEADWAYLQLARQRLAATYRGLLDRWQAWFVQCNPDAPFPQWTKTVHPSLSGGMQPFGPMPDKHAAGRYIELLENAFDLCRYHHILVQAPNAAACAYKEMGRCPAPCDGSISMDDYRRRMQESVGFADTPIDQWRSKIEHEMLLASGRLDFEAAARSQQLLERTKLAARAEFARVGSLRDFVFLSIMPGGGRTRARVFLIRGGWIQPITTIALNITEELIDGILRDSRALAVPTPEDYSPAALENIGMVCWHLFRPKSAKPQGSFLRLDDGLDVHTVTKSLRMLQRDKTEPDSVITEQDVENISP